MLLVCANPFLCRHSTMSLTKAPEKHKCSMKASTKWRKWLIKSSQNSNIHRSDELQRHQGRFHCGSEWIWLPQATFKFLVCLVSLKSKIYVCGCSCIPTVLFSCLLLFCVQVCSCEHLLIKWSWQPCVQTTVDELNKRCFAGPMLRFYADTGLIKVLRIMWLVHIHNVFFSVS